MAIAKRGSLVAKLSILSVVLLSGHTTAAWAQAPPAMPPGKDVMVFGQRIHYYEAGQGTNVIFLHGLGSEASSWAPNIGPIGQKYHVYALDQIGYGDSAKPLIEYKIATFVDFLQGFMQALKIPKATVVGNSLGGWIAVDFAARHPELLDRLVLVDAAGLDTQPHQNLPVDLNPGSLEGMRKMLEFIFYNKRIVTDDLVRRVFERKMKLGDEYTVQRTVAGLIAYNQFENENVKRLHAPTLLIWGREDQLTPLWQGENFQKSIAGSKLVVINECGHVPQLEKPVEFNAALLEFLAQP